MRRFVLLLSVMAVTLVGFLAPTMPSRAMAQEATPAAMGEMPPLLVAWAEAWSSGDPEQLAALYAPDGVYEEIPAGVVAEGPEAISAFVAETYAAFPVVQITPRSGFQADGWAVMEADFAGESADGVPFSVPFIVLFELEGDLIVRNADYFDLAALTAQLEAPAAEATPAA